MTPATRHSPIAVDQLPPEALITLMRLRARAWGVAAGLLAGFTLYAATIVLVIRDGPHLGAHLSLLAVFLPGYTVSWIGSIVGFAYAFVFGYVMGWIVGKVYNLAERAT